MIVMAFVIENATNAITIMVGGWVGVLDAESGPGSALGFADRPCFVVGRG
jgi:hypothetical protein